MTEKQHLEFEEALAELKTIASRVEDPNIRLRDAISQFERAQVLHELCVKELQEAENRIRVLDPKEQGE